MKTSNVATIPFFLQHSVKAFYTLSSGGFSEQPFSSFNLAQHVGDSVLHVRQNRNMLAQTLQINVNRLVFANQTHSSNVVNVLDENYRPVFENTDAMVTSVKGLCLCILTADCVPMLFYDKAKQVIGAAHAGWRGTVADIASKTVKLMIDEHRCNAADIMVYMGPCISGKVYEVGSEVHKQFELINLIDAPIFTQLPSEKYLLDLKQANRELLLQTGVLSNHIFTDMHCTYTQKDDFFSARRSGINTGRLVTGILLNP